MKVDQTKNKQDNYLVIEGSDQVITINKRDLVFKNTGDHKHHYLPDFTDEWEKAIALVCAIPGCIHGQMRKKEGKQFMSWLEGHRAKTRGANLLN